MGIGSWWHWVIVLLIVVLIFGTKKLKNIGEDLGSAVKGFKDGMKEGGKAEDEKTPAQQVGVEKNTSSDGQTIDVQAKDNSASDKG